MSWELAMKSRSLYPIFLPGAWLISLRLLVMLLWRSLISARYLSSFSLSRNNTANVKKVILCEKQKSVCAALAIRFTSQSLFAQYPVMQKEQICGMKNSRSSLTIELRFGLILQEANSKIALLSIEYSLIRQGIGSLSSWLPSFFLNAGNHYEKRLMKSGLAVFIVSDFQHRQQQHR